MSDPTSLGQILQKFWTVRVRQGECVYNHTFIAPDPDAACEKGIEVVLLLNGGEAMRSQTTVIGVLPIHRKS